MDTRRNFVIVLLVTTIVAGCTEPPANTSNEPEYVTPRLAERPGPSETEGVPANVATTQIVGITLAARKDAGSKPVGMVVLESVTTGLETLVVDGTSTHITLRSYAGNASALRGLDDPTILGATTALLPIRKGDTVEYAPPKGTRSLLVHLETGAQETSRSEAYVYDWEGERWSETRVWNTTIAPASPLRGETLVFHVQRAA